MISVKACQSILFAGGCALFLMLSPRELARHSLSKLHKLVRTFQHGWTDLFQRDRLCKPWSSMKQPRLKVRLHLEPILGVIDRALSRCTCRAQRSVDPWHFGHPRTYTCSSHSNPAVTKQLTLARTQLQIALDCLTTSAVLNHLLQRKSLQFGLC